MNKTLRMVVLGLGLSLVAGYAGADLLPPPPGGGISSPEGSPTPPDYDATPAQPNGPGNPATPALPGNPKAYNQVMKHRRGYDDNQGMVHGRPEDMDRPGDVRPDIEHPNIEHPNIERPEIERPDVQVPHFSH